MNIPNILTIMRIVVTPIVVFCLLYEQFIVALLIFIAAGISDALDGMIARRYNQKTIIGSYLDPIADKILLNTLFIVLATMGLIPWWMTTIVILRDSIILIGIIVLQLTLHKIEVNPLFISKATTVAQIVTIAWAILATSSKLMGLIFPFIMWTAAIMTMLSGFQYIYIGATYLDEQGG